MHDPGETRRGNAKVRLYLHRGASFETPAFGGLLRMRTNAWLDGKPSWCGAAKRSLEP